MRIPGSNWGFGALLKDTSVVVLRVERALYIHSPNDNPCRAETRTHNLWITSPTIRPRLPPTYRNISTNQCNLMEVFVCIFCNKRIKYIVVIDIINNYKLLFVIFLIQLCHSQCNCNCSYFPLLSKHTVLYLSLFDWFLNTNVLLQFKVLWCCDSTHSWLEWFLSYNTLTKT